MTTSDFARLLFAWITRRVDVCRRSPSNAIFALLVPLSGPTLPVHRPVSCRLSLRQRPRPCSIDHLGECFTHRLQPPT
jgi:hypothetical protein